MRRRILALWAAVLAAGLVAAISLFLTSEISPAVGQETTEPVSQGSIAEGPGTPPEDFPPYSQIVDDADLERFSAPGWESRSTNPDGYKGDYHVAGGTEPAQFRVEIPATDVYSVYAWWPTSADNSAAAHYGVNTTAGVEWTEPPVNQQLDSGMWVKLGEYEMAAGESFIQVSPDSADGGHVVADAVAVVRGVLTPPPEDGMIDVVGGKPTGRDVVRVARTHIGTRYGHNPCRKGVEEDCSCHTKLVFKRFGWKLPDDPARQWKYGRKVAKSDLRPGDLVFFKEAGPNRPITHVGIYSGHGELVHASKYWRAVREKPMKYINGYFGAKRLNPR